MIDFTLEHLHNIIPLTSFWATPEVSAWSRDFGYEEYVALHEKMGFNSTLLTPQGYDDLCEMLFNEMMRTLPLEGGV